MSSSMIEKAKRSSVCTEACDDNEKKLAKQLLEKVVKAGKFSEDELFNSLCIPPERQYMESTMLRFLRARNHDLELASTMIHEAMNLRRKYDIDNILKQPVAKEVLLHLRKGVYEGIAPKFDEFGRPVMLLEGGKSNQALFALLKPPAGREEWSLQDLEDVWIHWHVIIMEYVTKILFAEATKKKGSLINKYVVWDDLKGFSLLGVRGLMGVISGFKKAAYFDALLYPEILAFLVFTNSPQIFRQPWKIISSFIDKVTVEKIFILGGPSHYEPLVEYLFPNKNDVPEFMGGTLVGNHVTSADDPNTVMYDKIEAMLEENVKKHNYDKHKRFQPLQRVTVGAGKEVVVTHVVQPNKLVEYQFGVDSHDIAFSAEFHSSSGSTKKVFDENPKQSSSDARHCGRFLADEAGKVHLKFSNKHSKFRSKVVRYRVYDLEHRVFDGTEEPQKLNEIQNSKNELQTNDDNNKSIDEESIQSTLSQITITSEEEEEVVVETDVPLVEKPNVSSPVAAAVAAVSSPTEDGSSLSSPHAITSSKIQETLK